MKNKKNLSLFALLLFFIPLSSCSAIASIFKAGMGFGAFIVIAVILVIVIILMRANKK